MSSSRITYKYNSSSIAMDKSVMDFKNKITDPKSRLLKRILDIVLAILMLVLIAPWLFTLVAILIVLDSKGSPFFVQKRAGLNREVFYCVKFRTMITNAQANRMQVQEDDKRITRLGKFLRAHHIDELPQVFNVLAGNMSIVGPRPHMVRHDIECSHISANYKLRYQVKPGMTGLAQVRGYHGTISNREEFFNRLNSDIEYMQNWSLWMDIDIFVRTSFQKLFNIE